MLISLPLFDGVSSDWLCDLTAKNWQISSKV